MSKCHFELQVFLRRKRGTRWSRVINGNPAAWPMYFQRSARFSDCVCGKSMLYFKTINCIKWVLLCRFWLLTCHFTLQKETFQKRSQRNAISAESHHKYVHITIDTLSSSAENSIAFMRSKAIGTLRNVICAATADGQISFRPSRWYHSIRVSSDRQTSGLHRSGNTLAMVSLGSGEIQNQGTNRCIWRLGKSLHRRGLATSLFLFPNICCSGKRFWEERFHHRCSAWFKLHEGLRFFIHSQCIHINGVECQVWTGSGQHISSYRDDANNPSTVSCPRLHAHHPHDVRILAVCRQTKETSSFHSRNSFAPDWGRIVDFANLNLGVGKPLPLAVALYRTAVAYGDTAFFQQCDESRSRTIGFIAIRSSTSAFASISIYILHSQ